MAVTPTGRLSLPLLNSQTIVSNSSNFQTWVGAAGDASAAAARFYMVGNESVTRPFGMAYHNDGTAFTMEMIAGGAAHYFVDSGSVMWLFEDDIDAADLDDLTDAELAFTNTVGAILSDVLLLAGQSGYMTVTGIDKRIGPRREGKDEKNTTGQYFQIGFEVSWKA